MQNYPMAENPDKSPDFPIGELRDITLLIPGEHFFCETLTIPPELKPEDFQDFAQQALDLDSFSPYPSEQLAWGFHACENARKIIVFATPFVKMRQMGWQNLEFFRRVLPSFVSLLSKEFDRPSIAFLLHDETLTAASFEAEATVPEALYSLPVDPSNQDEIDSVRGKLLGMFDLAHFERIEEILTTGEVNRTGDGIFHFHNEWLDSSQPELDQSVTIRGEDLWRYDLRPLDFKIEERKRRNQARLRWRGVLGSFMGMAALFLLFVGLQIAEVKLGDLKTVEQAKNLRKPQVLASMGLLRTLEENKLGGINPIDSLKRIMVHRTIDTKGEPTLYLTAAEFKSRYELELEGKARNIPSINAFFDKLVQAEIVEDSKKRPDMKSLKDGWVEFDVSIQMKDMKDEDATLTDQSSSPAQPQAEEG